MWQQAVNEFAIRSLDGQGRSCCEAAEQGYHVQLRENQSQTCNSQESIVTVHVLQQGAGMSIEQQRTVPVPYIQAVPFKAGSLKLP